MWKYIVATFVGVFIFVSGGMDGWLFGISVSYNSHLVGFGIMTLLATFVVAGIMFFRQKSRKPKVPLVRVLVTVALCGVSDAFAETAHKWVLTPPDTTPIQRWNPGAIMGPEFWAIAVVATVALAIIYLHFFKRYFD